MAICQLVAGIALLVPGVAVVVVAERLPEAGLVLFQQPQAPDPFCALPEVEVRHDQAGRSAVLRLERLVVVAVGDERLAVGGLVEWQVRGVPAVAEGADVGRVVVDLDVLEEGVQAHAFPLRVQLAPLGDAVDVHDEGLLWQLQELVPGPADRRPDEPFDAERPAVQRRARRRSRREDRKVARQVLAGRESARYRRLPPALEPARYEAIAHLTSCIEHVHCIRFHTWAGSRAPGAGMTPSDWSRPS